MFILVFLGIGFIKGKVKEWRFNCLSNTTCLEYGIIRRKVRLIKLSYK